MTCGENPDSTQEAILETNPVPRPCVRDHRRRLLERRSRRANHNDSSTADDNNRRTGGAGEHHNRADHHNRRSTTTTAAPATTTTAGGIVAGEDPDVDAVVLTYQIVFSSATTYEEKAPYLVDPTGLEETVTQYGETGKSMGGVELAPNAVTIDGDVAEVQYDFLIGGTPTYPDLSGDAVLLDGVWKVTREMFCGIMTSARVGCPTS